MRGWEKGERKRAVGRRRIAALAVAIFLVAFISGLFLREPSWKICPKEALEEAEVSQENQNVSGESPIFQQERADNSSGEIAESGSGANSGGSGTGGESTGSNANAVYTGYIICLDPGHADTPYQIDAETGLNTQDWANQPEMSIVFDIALRAKGILESRGVRVVMTKSSVSAQVNLKQRAITANQCGAYLVVHIHTDPGISSPTTFFPGPAPNNWKANSQTGRKAYVDAGVQARSQKLAGLFHSAMSTTLQRLTGSPKGGVAMENRGATGTGNYGPVLTYDIWSKVPTFTLENNQSFANSHRQEIAQSIADGVIACLGK